MKQYEKPEIESVLFSENTYMTTISGLTLPDTDPNGMPIT